MEKFQRRDIFDGNRRIGCVSVRYPETELKKIDRFYSELAEAFFFYAVRHRLCGMLSCRVTYEDEERISVANEARLYKENETVTRHRSSLVWEKKGQRLLYLRRRGKRCCNVVYDGRELRFFD